MLDIKLVVNNKEYVYPYGVSLLDVSYDFKDSFKSPIMGAMINNELYDLSKTLDKDCEITFVDGLSREGSKIYQNGLIFIMIVAVKELYGDLANIKVCHSIDKGKRIKTDFRLTKKRVNDIKIKMQEIIDANLVYEKCLVKKEDAINYFNQVNDFTKASALNYLESSYLYLYRLDGFYDSFYSLMPYSTSYINKFDLLYLDNENFLLQYPSSHLGFIKEYKPLPNIMEAFNENYKHAKKLNIFCASDLNKALADDRIEDIIKLNEVILNDNLLAVAKEIYKRKDKLKIVLIAGPSSSGKTTTAKKLSMFLQTFGLNPKPLSTDDYFIPREKTPKLPNGEYDYESLRAVDVSLFNDHLTRLLNHEEVSIPTFNFYKGVGEYLGNTLKLDDNDILIIEGLHGLNENLTLDIPKECKYKIYVSPLNDLNIDDHNMISTSDIRLLRRMVRDNRTRGYNAEHTLRTWSVVRDGEEKNIFPYQGEADFVYNTAFNYEVGVLKLYAEPLLYQVSSSSKYYYEARRLLNFLSMFLAIPTEAIPNDSLLKEFIGNSYFERN